MLLASPASASIRRLELEGEARPGRILEIAPVVFISSALFQGKSRVLFLFTAYFLRFMDRAGTVWRRLWRGPAGQTTGVDSAERQ